MPGRAPLDRHQDPPRDAGRGHLGQRRVLTEMEGTMPESEIGVPVPDYVCIGPGRRSSGRTSGSRSSSTCTAARLATRRRSAPSSRFRRTRRVGRRCKISSHTFICEGVTIEDHVFVGHGVTFINDIYPRATTGTGELQTEKDWNVEATLVRRGASIGSGATILCERRHRRERHRRRRQRGHPRRARQRHRGRQPRESPAVPHHQTRDIP